MIALSRERSSFLKGSPSFRTSYVIPFYVSAESAKREICLLMNEISHPAFTFKKDKSLR